MSTLLLFVGGSVPVISVALGDSPHKWVALLVDVPALMVSVGAFFALGRLSWLPVIERLMLGTLLAFVGVWDVVNIVLSRPPSAGDHVTLAPIFLLACILLCLMVSIRGQRRWLLILFATHFGLTWVNLLRSPWQENLHTNQILLDVLTLISLLLLSLIGLYQRMLSSAEHEALEMRGLAHTDSLTQLPNRRAMYAALEEHRTGAVLLLDLDDFKVVNDVFGHPHGDEVLMRIARTLAEQSAGHGIVGRWGGEEFLVVLPAADLAAALAWADRARRTVEGLPGVSTTLSIGVAVPQPPETFARLLARVDEQLYLAKTDGKNRVRPELARLTSKESRDP